jgi:hypothetical protein
LLLSLKKTQHYKSLLFEKSCCLNDIELIKILFEKSDTNINWNDAFFNALTTGNKDIINLVNDYISKCEKTFYLSQSSFHIYCSSKNVNIDIVKDIINSNKIQNNNTIQNNTFFSICSTKNLDLVKWFYENNKNIYNSLECCHHIFYKLCVENYFEIAKWYFKIYQFIDIRISNDKLFKDCIGVSYYKNNIPLIKWLCELCDDYHIVMDGYTFIKSFTINDNYMNFLDDKISAKKVIKKLRLRLI